MSVSPPLCSGDATVGVVVPLYNSQATIDETLCSITGQTHQNLDIVVVDDGSTDRGPAMVEEWQARDSRIRLVTQFNSGVAAARNTGAAAAAGELIAFCDADDLWAPRKIEAQLNALAASGGRSEFVYCWFAIINSDSRVTCLDYRPPTEGHVLSQLFNHNFVGNGSSFLVSRALFNKIGGFDESMRAKAAQGCEDYRFCLQAAELTEFTLVREFLLGYRLFETSMSGNAAGMSMSHECVMLEFQGKYPAQSSQLRTGYSNQTLWLAQRALRHRRYRTAVTLLGRLDRATKQRRAKYLLSGLIKGIFIPPAVVRAVRRFTLPTFSEFANRGRDAVSTGET